MEQSAGVHCGAMKRAPITIAEAALRRFLQKKQLQIRQYQPPRGPFRITPAPKGSGKRDVSVEHDRYLAERME